MTASAPVSMLEVSVGAAYAGDHKRADTSSDTLITSIPRFWDLLLLKLLDGPDGGHI